MINLCATSSEEDDIDLIGSCLSLMNDYIHENPAEISEPDFEESMKEEVKELLVSTFAYSPFDTQSNSVVSFFEKKQEQQGSPDVDFDEYMEEIIEFSLDMFYIHIIPPRSYPDTFILCHPNIKSIKKKLHYLVNKKQPQQRTPEWYEFRHNLITASNAYKAFESQSMQNQLIYEKCKPLIIDNNKSPFTNVNSSLHHGQKYEPISAMLYEEMYETTLLELGCIQHDTYSFLGASPDGINNRPDSPRYGRLLEIKNIVNREIDGIPKKEYWIQMQLQMETCDLDETDFLECRFVEYENESAFHEDGDFFVAEKGERKGIILYFANPQGNPVYEYKSLSMNCKEFNQWQDIQIEEKMQQGLTWIKNIYWKLDEISCVLVLRNQTWFADNISTLQDIWNIIEKERESGYSHREPKRSQKSLLANVKATANANVKANAYANIVVKLDTPIHKIENLERRERSGSGCFLHIDKLSNKTTIL